MSTANTIEMFTAPVRQKPGSPAPTGKEAPGDKSPVGNGPAVRPGFLFNPPPVGKGKYKFRLMAGPYVDYEGEKTDLNRDGRRFFQVNRLTGVFPIIETDLDLSIYNGKAQGMQEKFARLHIDKDIVMQVADPTQRLPGETVQAYIARMNDLRATLAKQTDAVLKTVDDLTLEQLNEYAATEEIDLKGAKTLDAVRKIVKAHLSS